MVSYEEARRREIRAGAGGGETCDENARDFKTQEKGHTHTCGDAFWEIPFVHLVGPLNCTMPVVCGGVDQCKYTVFAHLEVLLMMNRLISTSHQKATHIEEWGVTPLPLRWMWNGDNLRLREYGVLGEYKNGPVVMH